MTDIRLIAIDLDGTLLDSAKRLDPAFPGVLAQLLERGVTVVPASGRQLESIRRSIAEGPDGEPAPLVDGAQHPTADLAIIAENGAYVSRGSETLAIDGVPRSAVAVVFEAVARYRASGGTAATVLAGAASAYVSAAEIAAHPEFLATSEPYYPLLAVVDDLAAVEDEILKIAVWDPNGSEHGVATAIGEVPGARTLVSAGVWVDVMSPTADKGHALAALQEQLGITPAQTMAFGDYPNDLGMLARAEHSYAMAGAHPAVTAAARHVAPSNDDSGVVSTIRAVLGLD